MTAFSVDVKNEKQLAAIKAFLDALDLNYKFDDTLNETIYLNSTEANKKALDESIAQAEKGNYKKITVSDIWK